MPASELPARSSPAPRPVGPRPQRPSSRRLDLDGVSSDGRQLVLKDAEGLEFTVDIDARLRAALADGPGRRLENKMDSDIESQMRPRDIQARIRAGETPESVAEAARTTVEKLMPYAAPVMAEREHVAERAQRSSIRRPAGDHPGAARTLGEAVAGRLRTMNVDPGTVSWDSWRREDGRWSIVGRFETRERSGLAELTFDQPGNYVVLDNDDARWLVGEEVAAPVEHVEVPTGHGKPRRLSAVPQAELPLGEDAIELVTDSGIGADQPMEAFLDVEPAFDETALREEAADAAALDEDPAADEPPSRRPVKKTRGRASVPSWDEIMFGGSTDS
jgi:hypothetical protein